MFSDLMAGYWRFADKLKVRDYVKSIIGEKYVTKLYGVYEKYDEIDFSSLALGSVGFGGAGVE